MIDGEDLGAADKTARFTGMLSGGTAREVHDALCRICDVDSEALVNFIDHSTMNVDRFMKLKNTEKDLIAVAIRHGFAVGAISAQRNTARKKGEQE